MTIEQVRKQHKLDYYNRYAGFRNEDGYYILVSIAGFLSVAVTDTSNNVTLSLKMPPAHISL